MGSSAQIQSEQESRWPIPNLGLKADYFLFYYYLSGESANAVPHTKKLRTRVAHIWGDRKGQPNRKVQWKGLALGGPPCWSGYLPYQVSMPLPVQSQRSPLRDLAAWRRLVQIWNVVINGKVINCKMCRFFLAFGNTHTRQYEVSCDLL